MAEIWIDGCALWECKSRSTLQKIAIFLIFCFLIVKEFDKNYDEWAVLYHGTFQENAHLIMQTGLIVTVFFIKYLKFLF